MFPSPEMPNKREQAGDIISVAMYDVADGILLPTYTLMASLSEIIMPNQLPMYRPGTFGHRDLSIPWTEKSPRDKFHDDKLVLLEAFTGFVALAMISLLAEDELIRGVRDMRPGKPV